MNLEDCEMRETVEAISCWPPEDDNDRLSAPYSPDHPHFLPSSPDQLPILHTSHKRSLSHSPEKISTDPSTKLSSHTFNISSRNVLNCSSSQLSSPILPFQPTNQPKEAQRKRHCHRLLDPADNTGRDHYDLADLALVKWWKKRLRETGGLIQNDSTLGAYSKMNIVARSSEGQAFLGAQLKRLMSLPAPGDAHLQTVIASYLEKLGRFDEAKEFLCRALAQEPGDKDVLWLLARVEKQLQVLYHQKIAVPRASPQMNALPPSRDVDRVHCDDLSFKDFFMRYALSHTPVIIQGLQVTKTPWTLQHIKQQAGSCTVIPKRLVSGSVEWAKLENASQTTVAEYIDNLQEDRKQHTESTSSSMHRDSRGSIADENIVIDKCSKHERQKDTYLFDWSLPQHAPNLAEEITIPRYFAGDLLQRVTEGSLYRDTWPSLFIAPAGLKSELHVDTFASNFWMALLQGKKRWLFFGRDDLPLLYPHYPHSMDPCFEVDVVNPDFSSFPLLANTQPRECILEAGEVLFVPSGCPHYVENLTQSIAISANFVDPSNLSLVLQELEIHALKDPRAEELTEELRRTCGDLILNEREKVGIGEGEGDGESGDNWNGKEAHRKCDKGEEIEGGGERTDELRGHLRRTYDECIPTERERDRGRGEFRKDKEEIWIKGKAQIVEKTVLEADDGTIPSESQRQNQLSVEADNININTIQQTNSQDKTLTIHNKQTEEQNKISPQIKAWIKAVENHGDLKWRDFKKLQLCNVEPGYYLNG